MQSSVTTEKSLGSFMKGNWRFAVPKVPFKRILVVDSSDRFLDVSLDVLEGFNCLFFRSDIHLLV